MPKYGMRAMTGDTLDGNKKILLWESLEFRAL